MLGRGVGLVNYRVCFGLVGMVFRFERIDFLGIDRDGVWYVIFCFYLNNLCLRVVGLDFWT